MKRLIVACLILIASNVYAHPQKDCRIRRLVGIDATVVSVETAPHRATVMITKTSVLISAPVNIRLKVGEKVRVLITRNVKLDYNVHISK